MKIHKLKINPEYFEAILSEEKRFEVRKFDRDFQVGDILDLHEWNPESGNYSGRQCQVAVLYILHGGQYGIGPDYCVLSIEKRDLDDVGLIQL